MRREWRERHSHTECKLGHATPWRLSRLVADACHISHDAVRSPPPRPDVGKRCGFKTHMRVLCKSTRPAPAPCSRYYMTASRGVVQVRTFTSAR